MKTSIARTLFTLGSLVGLGMAGTAAADEPIVVVELFTSQGCSSCPPADDFLAELAKRPDVVALGFHVDYWDRLGWKDPYAARWATDRQYDYAAAMDSNRVYTPQMVVDGTLDAVGSRRVAVDTAIAASREKAPERVPVTLRRAADGTLEVSVAAGTGKRAQILLAGYDSRHETAVRRGENRGRTLANTNVVRSLTAIGSWTGAAASFAVPSPPTQGVAVLVQETGRNGVPGRILGAAKLER